jgi:hypothetical protein
VFFHEKVRQHLAKNLLFSVRPQDGAFSGVSIPPPMQREFTKKDCFLCDSTLLFVFKKKVCIPWARTFSFL